MCFSETQKRKMVTPQIMLIYQFPVGNCVATVTVSNYFFAKHHSHY